MFIQVIQGKIADVDGLRSAVQRWSDEIAPHVTGWLGTTGGVTADGTAIAVVRFESEEAARRNSDRPEQQQWWAEASKHFAGEVTFHDCTETLKFLDGGSDDAGFVQVIRGKVDDVERLKAMAAHDDDLHRMRPEILGATLAIEKDGTFTQTVAFTDEESARRGEAQDVPDDVREVLEYAMSGATFFDLRHPWFESA